MLVVTRKRRMVDRDDQRLVGVGGLQFTLNQSIWSSCSSASVSLTLENSPMIVANGVVSVQ